MQVHPTAIIQGGARLGAGCVVHAYAMIGRHCELGERVVVHPFAVIGGDPQDLGFNPDTLSGVRIGAGTVLREHVTISRATKAGTYTEVGSDCFLMAGSHVAHDCRIGERVVMANAVLLAGHVQVDDRAFLGGGAVVHQFCRIGESAMIGGGARIARDVPPYCMATERNILNGLNLVGLRRRGFPRTVVDEIKRAFREIDVPVGNLPQIAAAALQRGAFASIEAQNLLRFYASGQRGFVRTRRVADPDAGGGDSLWRP